MSIYFPPKLFEGPEICNIVTLIESGIVVVNQHMNVIVNGSGLHEHNHHGLKCRGGWAVATLHHTHNFTSSFCQLPLMETDDFVSTLEMIKLFLLTIQEVVIIELGDVCEEICD